MLKKAFLAVVGLFWVGMNVLLWRAEYGSYSGGGPSVPLDTVWQKVLTAPDLSNLVIYQHGRKIGVSRWSAAVLKGTSGRPPKTPGLEDQVAHPEGFSLDLEGNVTVLGHKSRFRFDLNILLDPTGQWTGMGLRASHRPTFWEIRAKAEDKSVYFRLENAEGKWHRTFTAAELSNPFQLFDELGMGFLPNLLGYAPDQIHNLLVAPEVKWDAHNHWLPLRRAQVRVYRVRAQLSEKLGAVIYISRVGEILRVELPFHLILVNDALASGL